MSATLLEQFVAEATDLLAEVDEGLLRLERDPADRPLVDAVFRAAHTLKGSSGLFELAELTRLTHAAEDLLEAVRSGSTPLDGAAVDLLLQAFDAVRSWLPSIAATGRVPAGQAEAAESLAARLRAPLGGQPPGPVPVGPSPVAAAGSPGWLRALPAELLERTAAWLGEAGASLRALRYVPDPGCFFRGEDPLQLLREVPALAGLSVTVPGAVLDDDYDEFACRTWFTALTRASRRELDHVFRYLPEQVEVVEVDAAALRSALAPLPGPVEPGEPPVAGLDAALRAAVRRVLEVAPDPASLRAATDLVRRLAAGAGRPVGADETSVPGLLVVLDELDRGPAPAAPAGVPQPRHTPDEPAPGHAPRTLKVDQAKVDRLLDLVGELVVATNALPFVAAAAAEQGHRALARRVDDEHGVLSRVGADLQQAVMEVRMLPLATAFARAPRLVRDLARQLSREVVLVEEGGDVAADKDVVEMLAEPLVHLLRNALDHGVEPTDERRAAGKPEQARLCLRGRADGDAVVVEVEDDGRGVDARAVRERALERDLLPAGELASLSDEQVVQLVFAPGFSTAREVSDVSGRGVGMDAVRTSVERAGGTVELLSRPGAGTTVVLRLPLTMAVSRVLLLTVAGQRFGVPLDDVVETVRVEAGQVRVVAARSVLVLRDALVPLVDLSVLLGLRSAPFDEDRTVLVVRGPSGPLGLAVDTVQQAADVLLRPLTGLLGGVPGYCGTALLGDGLVLLVLEVKELDRAARAA